MVLISVPIISLADLTTLAAAAKPSLASTPPISRWPSHRCRPWYCCWPPCPRCHLPCFGSLHASQARTECRNRHDGNPGQWIKAARRGKADDTQVRPGCRPGSLLGRDPIGWVATHHSKWHANIAARGYGFERWMQTHPMQLPVQTRYPCNRDQTACKCGCIRKRAVSRAGGSPYKRRYSRLNCDGLSYPTANPTPAALLSAPANICRAICKRMRF